jgi:hypothetical protein
MFSLMVLGLVHRNRFSFDPPLSFVLDTHLLACILLPRSSSTSKWLLTHYGTGALVIDIKVPCCMSKHLSCRDDGRTIPSKDGAGKSIGTGLISHLEPLFEFPIWIGQDSEERPKDLLLHSGILWIGGK